MSTPASEPVETELKFALGPGARAALQADLLRDGKVSSLSATYFDTPDATLFANGYGLRVRRAGDRFIQTLKSAGGGLFSRGEWEADVPSAALDAAVLLATPIATLVSVATLQPLFTVDVRRTVAVVRRGSSRIEACLDLGEVRAGERSELVEELELELIEGAPADLFALARRLDANLTLAFATKAERGYRLARGLAMQREGPEAALRALSEAILAEDAPSAAAAAGVLGAQVSTGAFDRVALNRVLLDAAERLSARDTRV